LPARAEWWKPLPGSVGDREPSTLHHRRPGDEKGLDSIYTPGGHHQKRRAIGAASKRFGKILQSLSIGHNRNQEIAVGQLFERFA
jgi:hypothetical protein